MYLYVDESVPPVGLIHIKNLLDQFYGEALEQIDQGEQLSTQSNNTGEELDQKNKNKGTDLSNLLNSARIII